MRPLAAWRIWLVGAAVYAAVAGVFFGTRAPFAVPTVEALCGEPAPDVRLTSTAAQVHAFLEACGPAGRAAYRSLQLVDLAYPALFGVVLASSLALALRYLAPGRRDLLALAALPLLASLFDYLENVAAWLALLAYPAPGPADGLLGLASAAKSVTTWTAVVLLLGLLLGLALVRLRVVTNRRGTRAEREAG